VERSEDRTLQTVTDLANEIAEFVDLLSSGISGWNRANIERSLSFCLSLHRELVAELSHSKVIVPSDDWTGVRR
jgi:hypothetical protein